MNQPTRPTPREIEEYHNLHGCNLKMARGILMLRYMNNYKEYLKGLCKDADRNLEEILTGIIELI